MESRINVTPGFCPNCGSILPPLKSQGSVICFLCSKEFDPSIFGRMEVEYTVHFNKIIDKRNKNKEVNEEESEGPVVERKCLKCGNNKMSYATLQLRSADEGQTTYRVTPSKFILLFLQKNKNMSEEEKNGKTDDGSEVTYEKAKEYWQTIEPTVCGMLGGLPEVGFLDIQASTRFLKLLFKFKPAPGRNRALDCGAGIGRVSKNLLMNEFQTVDLIEQDEKFCQKARESLANSGHLGEVFNVGLQDFNESDIKYDVVWSQWVLGHIEEPDLIQFFKRVSKMLNKNGIIVVKENFTKNNETIVDEIDSSVTRPRGHFKKILKESNLKIIKEERQTNFPKSLFPVYMLAMKPINK
ncbi:CLUMA_CG002216, isoform A [Clunio marinus]|uniref:Alpha N-terminal protein methyltransferase 1 n=1 Tax=Clunio marinus TaxID=568069 RepID=A0A1J1HKA0_9DIPT|nr:CLUMA_CG002216, isoform A [Clunio marinus]